METKKCCKCKEVLPVEMFGKNKSRADGMQSFCKPCMRKYSRQYILEHKEKRRLYKLQYDKSHSAENIKRGREYIARNQKAYKARTAIGNAVRDGKIIRPSYCSACGKPCKPDGHHEDYNKPLEVIWLCRSCHGRLHKKIIRDSQAYSNSQPDPSMEPGIFHEPVSQMEPSRE